MKWVETSSPYGTSGSNSTGKPRKPLKRSKVTCATCLTLEGKPISMEEGSQLLLLYLLQPIKDFLNDDHPLCPFHSFSSFLLLPHPPTWGVVSHGLSSRVKRSEMGIGFGTLGSFFCARVCVLKNIINFLKG